MKIRHKAWSGDQRLPEPDFCVPRDLVSILRQDGRGVIPMIRATLKMVLPLEKRQGAMEVLGNVAERSRSEPGCLSCGFYLDPRHEGALVLDQIWSTEEDLHRHLRSEDYRNVLLVVEMASEPPEIRFDVICATTGIETIEQARNGLPDEDRRS
jgi:quinol monooxygenase YgiN